MGNPPRLSSDYVALFVVLQPHRRPALEAHTEHQAVALQHFLDLGERLLAEVRRTQQLDFRALHQVADVVDVLSLEAVGAADGELELVDRTQQDRIELHLRHLGGSLFLALQVDEYRQLILENAAGAADGFLRIDGAVGLDVDDELVEVGALLDTRGIDRVGHAPYRREGSIELQTSDGAGLLLERHTRCRRAIAAATLDAQRHGELTRLGEVGDDELRIHDFDVVVGLDVASRHGTRAFLVQPQLGGVALMHPQRNGFEIEQDVDHVLLHALDAGVLVQHPVDLDLRDRAAGHGRQQHAPQRVAERVAEATLERLDHHARLSRSDRLHLDYTGPQKLTYRTLHLHSPCRRNQRPALRKTGRDWLQWGRLSPVASLPAGG